MSKIVMPLGFVVGFVSYAVGLIGLFATPEPHTVPTPSRVVSFGAAAMMGVLITLVMLYAHGSRTGDQE